MATDTPMIVIGELTDRIQEIRDLLVSSQENPKLKEIILQNCLDILNNATMEELQRYKRNRTSVALEDMDASESETGHL